MTRFGKFTSTFLFIVNPAICYGIFRFFETSLPFFGALIICVGFYFILSAFFLIWLRKYLADNPSFLKDEPSVNRDKTKKFHSAPDYIECPPFVHEAECGDDDCPCNDRASMPPNQGYIYIAPAVVEFRRDCPTLAEMSQKLHRMMPSGHGVPTIFTGGKNVYFPTVVCERAVRLRKLNMGVALNDFEMWKKTSKVPCRATPVLATQY